ncbi:MAG: hypothetical protein KDB48_06650 [Solirubrobacterales bacterium]|nr:hypothetical protein [Solirubrobacterales bacterium]HMT04505.1 hypothetical protein [Solirubrobacterales bacterium]
MRRVAVLLMILFAGTIFTGSISAVSTAAPADTSAKKTGKKKKKKVKAVKPRVQVLTLKSSQLARGKVKVKVRANKRAKIRVSATTGTFDVPSSQLAKGKTVRFGKKRVKVITLNLTANSKVAVNGCEARTLTFTVVNGKRRTKVTKSMDRDQAPCQLPGVDLTRAATCDFIAKPKEGMCMLPFPNDFYTVNDPSSPTGKRVNFTADAMPSNTSGTPINPGKFADSDGFSHGQGIVVRIPGVDSLEAVKANNLVPLNHLGDYASPDQKVVVINTRTGERHPIWAEADSNATSDQSRTLEIKPAENFDAGGHYIVALRNLTDVNGSPLTAPTAFRYYRDQIPSSQSGINDRRPHFEKLFEKLREAGIKRNDLYLAWDFTVASNENNYKRALSMRDRAFAELGDTNLGDQIVQGNAPTFQIDNVQTFTPIQNPRIARKIQGSFMVPCFLEPSCGPGGTMKLTADGLPTRNGYYQANLDCVVPQVGVEPGAAKTRPMVFGHGLFGRADGVYGGVNPELADTGMTLCATDEIGMASNDVVQVMTTALPDLSNFDVLADRLAQALINELYLARLMYHPQGLGTHAAFQDGDGYTAGESVIRTDHVFYMGASQGGILGGPLTALSPDFIQSSLLVGAMTYSILLPRSTNYDLYKLLLYGSYPDEMVHPLLLQLMQMLWDRSEPNGYTHVMTDNPPPNTPAHKITLQVALGDHQVSNFTSDTMARSLDMKTNQVPVDPGRWPDYDVLWNVPRLTSADFPYRGSNIIYFDGGPVRPNPNNPSQTIGTDVPPLINQPNRVAQDPHGAPGGASLAVAQTSSFLQPNGYISDLCPSRACYGDSWDGSLP